MRLAIFPVHLSKLLRRSYEVLHLSRKIISANLKIWGSKMQPLSGNQRPDLLTALMNMSLVLRLPRKMHLRSSSNVPRLPSFLEILQKPNVLLTFAKVHNLLRLPRETASERQKVVRACGAFNIFALKRASHHNGVHLFNISSSKTAPNPSVFYTFDFEMCFAPQRRALFRHLNFQKCSEPVSFWHFWLRNVLRAATACTFLTSQLPKVLRGWGVLYILTWGNMLSATTACNFSSLIWPAGSARAALASLLFDPANHKSLEKHGVSRLSYFFAHLDLLSSETFSFWSSLFFSSLLWLFPSLLFICPYCRKFDF